MSGVSNGTASTIRQELKVEIPLYRNEELEICLPIAYPKRGFGGRLGISTH
jgi:hypothetical protein